MACGMSCPANILLKCDAPGGHLSKHYQVFKARPIVAEYQWDDAYPNWYEEWVNHSWVTKPAVVYPPAVPPAAPAPPQRLMCSKVCPANTLLVCDDVAHTGVSHTKQFLESNPLSAMYHNEYYWSDNDTSSYYHWEPVYGMFDWKKIIPGSSETPEAQEPVRVSEEPVEITEWDLLPDAEFDKPLMTWEEHLKTR